MTTIVTRAGKGSPLTWNEVDNNFTNLNSAKYESGNNVSFGTIGGSTITASTEFSGAIGTTTPAASKFTSVSNSGNLTFTGTGNRITGDLSNATIANRVMFQTSTTNNTTIVGILPSGTGTEGRLTILNNSDPTLSAGFDLRSTTTEAMLRANNYGGGALPMTFYTGGSERMRIDTSGNVGIGTSSPVVGYSLTTQSRLYVNNQNTDMTPDASWSGQITAKGSAYNGGIALDATGLWLGHNSASRAILFATDETERMRIDSSGNVGIGTSSPGSTGKFVVDFVGDGSKFASFLSTSVGVQSYGAYATSHVRMTYPAVADWDLLANSGGALTISKNATERMRITSAGLVLLNTTTNPTGGGVALAINGNGSANSNGGVQITYSGAGGGGGAITTPSGAGMQFFTFTGAVGSESYSERMRIDSSGNVLVNATSNPGAAKLYVTNNNDAVDFRATGAAGYSLALRTSYTSNNGNLVYLGGSSSQVGSISTNNSTTTYGTSSDYRLKENVTPMINALGTVAKLNPVTYTWKNTKIDDTGFIAHELQEYFPNAVTGEKDAVDADGNPIYQCIDTSFLVATLTKAIQEQQELIKQLQADVALLKGN